MKKRLLSLLLVIVLMCSALPMVALARDLTQAENTAYALKSIGLFSGVSDNDFALNRAPTRAEAILMFLRIKGEAQYALNNNYSHPFKDVPTWCSPYVGWAYRWGYTAGVSATAFNPDATASGAQYLTFTLRALGYSDENGRDFTWDAPFELARSVGLLSGVDTSKFLRADSVLVSWASLFIPLKNGNPELPTIAEALVATGRVTQEQLAKAKDIVKNGPGGSKPGEVPAGYYVCYTDAAGFTYDPRYRPVIHIMSDNTFDLTLNYGEGMAEGVGTWRADSSGNLSLTVTTSPWYDLQNYSFYLGSNHIKLESERIGITLKGAKFEFEKNYGTVEPTPSPTPTPDNKVVGSTPIPGDNTPTTNMKTLFKFNLGKMIIDFWDDPPTVKNPTGAANLLRQLRDGEKFLAGSVLNPNNGYISDIYQYWGTRAGLETWCKKMLAASSNTIKSFVSDQNIQAFADFMVRDMAGIFLGNKLDAYLKGDTHLAKQGYSYIQIYNQPSEGTIIPGVKAKVAYANMSTEYGMYRNDVTYTFRWDNGGLHSDEYLPVMTVAEITRYINNIGSNEGGRAIAIDPEQCVIALYDKSYISSHGFWDETLWYLKADVNSAGQLLLKGSYLSIEDQWRLGGNCEFTVDVYTPGA